MLIFMTFIFYFIKRKEFHCTCLLSLSALCRSNALLFFGIFAYFKYPLIHLSLFLIPISLFQLFSLSKLTHLDCFPFADTFYSYLIKSEKHFLLSNSVPLNKIHLFSFYPPKIIIPYSLLQRKYWDQGFFRFFTVTNIPNMLCSLPFILFYTYYLIRPQKIPRKDIVVKFLHLLLAINTILTIFFLHWNTFFRFISYNPLIYWTISYKLIDHKKSFLIKLFLRYYFGFGVVYAILFGAFYPPA